MTITIDLPVKDIKELGFSSKEELVRGFVEYLFYKKKMNNLKKLLWKIKRKKMEDYDKLPSDEEILEVLEDL